MIYKVSVTLGIGLNWEPFPEVENGSGLGMIYRCPSKMGSSIPHHCDRGDDCDDVCGDDGDRDVCGGDDSTTTVFG